MDLMRRDSAGELSAGLALARYRATVGDECMGCAGSQTYVADASPARRAELEAYAEGVNAGLTSLETVPFEYRLCVSRPNPGCRKIPVL